MPGENENNVNNPAITQEAYDQLKSELEAERTKVAETVEQATQPLKERITSLETELQAKTEEASQQAALAEERGSSIASLSAQQEGAVTAYRELVQKSNPLLPAEMLQGGTIEEINASVEKAVTLVGQIRQGIEEQNKSNDQANNIPVGAPGRTPPDLENMTTREKITHGLKQAFNK